MPEHAVGVVLSRPDGDLRYWVAGDPGAPTVVGVHGVTLDHGAFGTQVPALLEAGYRVVTFDLAGHGRSRTAGGRLSVAAAAADLAALLDEVDASRAVLIGQSFGGFVVQQLYRRDPDRVAALVLAGAWLLGARPPLLQRTAARLRPMLLRVWPAGHLARTIPRFMSDRREVQRYVAAATSPLSKADLVAFTAAAVDGLVGSGQLLTIGVPALFVYGDSERPWVVRLTRDATEQAPDAVVASIPDAGHLVNQDQPARFNQILLDFLRLHVPANDPAS